MADISRTTVGRPSFRSLGDAGASGISAKTRNIHYGNQMNDIQGLPLFFVFVFLTSPSSFRLLVTFWVQIGTNLSYLLQNAEILQEGEDSNDKS